MNLKLLAYVFLPVMLAGSLLGIMPQTVFGATSCTTTSSTPVSFGSFNAPWYEQGIFCTQAPVLIASGLKTGDIITATDISGGTCPRVWPRSCSCVNKVSAGCSENGHSNLVSIGNSAFDTYNKVDFTDSNHKLIQEYPLSQLKNGISVPAGATSAYAAFLDNIGDNNDYFDNNGGMHITFNATVKSCAAVACNSNSDCGANGYTGAAFCTGNSVYQNYNTWTCNNPGRTDASCSSTTSAKKKNDCTDMQTCSNGSCSDKTITCKCDSDCGGSTFSGDNYCKDGSVYKNYNTSVCLNPGTTQSSCTSSIFPIFWYGCGSNQTCNGGYCHNRCQSNI